MELSSERSKDGKSVTLTYKYNAVNNSGLDSKTFNDLVIANASQTAKTFNGKTSNGLTVKTNMVRDDNATISWIYQKNSLDVEDVYGQYMLGYTDEIGNTQVNRIQINTYAHFGKDGKLNVTDEDKKQATQTGVHENVHV